MSSLFFLVVRLPPGRHICQISASKCEQWPLKSTAPFEKGIKTVDFFCSCSLSFVWLLARAPHIIVHKRRRVRRGFGPMACNFGSLKFRNANFTTVRWLSRRSEFSPVLPASSLASAMQKIANQASRVATWPNSNIFEVLAITMVRKRHLNFRPSWKSLY